MTLTLNDIPSISNLLKVGNTKTVKLLNSIIFNEDFNRNTRKKLRTFSAFSPDIKIEERKKYILDTFSSTDLICVLNSLGLETNGNTEELCNRLFKSLTNLSELQSLNTEFPDEEINNLEDDNDSEFSLGSASQVDDASPSINQRRSQNITEVENSHMDPSHYFMLRDLASSMRKFTSNDPYSVNSFLRDIEESFAFFPTLSEQQKVIFAKI